MVYHLYRIRAIQLNGERGSLELKLSYIIPFISFRSVWNRAFSFINACAFRKM